MAQSLAFSGTSAQIIPFPGPLVEPVVQQRRPGRNPKKVVGLRAFRSEKNFKKYKSEVKAKEMRSMQDAVDTYLAAAQAMRHSMALMQQR